ncbi:MAG: urea amidolyase related protein [Bryobacterales bacterium]|nr:urea amidolyase related protein [Bryobacterales bacterium]
MFHKVLVANRGVIACRILRTLRKMGIGSVAVYSEADRYSLHVEHADEAVCIGPPPPPQSYLCATALLDAAQKTGAEAIHPGYGFLSENAEFAEECAERGIVFMGPTPQQLRQFGLKHLARRLAEENRIPLIPGSALLDNATQAAEAAAAIGYPAMLKSTAGGGGIGMKLCRSETELSEAFEGLERLSQAAFASRGLYLEKFISKARHIEVQIFGNGVGAVASLGERDCSVQRRNQKVIEETPAPGLPSRVRAQLVDASLRLGRAVNYRSAGTVEFIYDVDTERFYFLEVNARLQVEHGVTEEVSGIDLVEWMVRLAAGDLRTREMPVSRSTGCSLQVRIYAEDPAKKFRPSPGRLSQVSWPDDVRVETWVESGAEITPFYDPMLAKIIVWGEDRREALQNMRDALAKTEIAGIETNLRYLRQVCAHPAFAACGVTTSFLRGFDYRRTAIEVLDPGTQTAVQDYPGRSGYWHVGVPPSGPMDSLAFRLANRLLDNPSSAAALEITVSGPTLRFTSETVIALTGTDFKAELNGDPVSPWRSVAVPAGSLLTMGTAEGAGGRAYLAIAGGFDVPEYMGSRSTFILGRFGGHAGRALRAGDVLHISPEHGSPAARHLPETLRPAYGRDWKIGVLYGPHGAPDFFTAADIEMFFSEEWKVHYNSDRTGIRLIGPKPVWSRKDGGEAGLHPSNIHDNPYAVGTVDFTGDMPVILGPDGPSLGGFVCPATIVQAELWKIGQLKPGDRVCFRPMTAEQSAQMERDLERSLETLTGSLPVLPRYADRQPPILREREETYFAPAVVCRVDGDSNLLVEYGPNVLDLDLRFRIHALEQQLYWAALPGILDITPGVRSLQIHYDTRKIRREALLEALDVAEENLPEMRSLAVKSRIVHLPLSWDDPATQLAISRYTQSVRPDAPWCPSNIEFIRRINGLASEEQVHRIVFDASYLVLGLGDVYLGAPVATPLDPRHRLVTTKYNPARTWTPENAVGIGGAYLCVYGMEGPGGYQFVGRTLQMWNTYRVTKEFQFGTPWLLRFFDQIRFYPVSARELLEIRDAFPHGKYPLRIETEDFRLADYHRFLASIESEAGAFKQSQQAAFVQERERWAHAGADPIAEPVLETVAPTREDALAEGLSPVRSPLVANVWAISVAQGQRVEAGQKLMVLEAMKMEIAITAPRNGIVETLNCVPGSLVSAGQNLITLRSESAT